MVREIYPISNAVVDGERHKGEPNDSRLCKRPSWATSFRSISKQKQTIAAWQVS